MILHRISSSVAYEQKEFVFKNTKRLYKAVKNLFNLKRTVRHIKKKSANDRAVEFTKALNKSFKEEKPTRKGSLLENLQKRIPNGAAAVTGALVVSGGLGLGTKKYLDSMDKVSGDDNKRN